MSYTSIIYKVNAGYAEIRLNRPDVLNSFNKTLAAEVQHALKASRDDKQVRAILLSAEGRGFCAGQDLAEAMSADAPPIREIVKTYYNPVIELLRSIEKPVICAVNGVAAGAGANIAIACDIVIAAKSASFIQSFSKIGLIPDSAGTFFLPRLIGLQRAAALMFTGDKLPAEEAQQIGLIYKVCEDSELSKVSGELAARLAAMPTKGIGLTKRALNLSMQNSLAQQLTIEEELQEQAGNSYDFKEGVKAFIEKRKPEFKGE